MKKTELYPLKFTPIVKDKIWGGDKLQQFFEKQQGDLPNIGESWEISDVPGNTSVVSNGALAGKTLRELIAEYKDDLVGEKVYKQSGDNFPLLFKLIDANDYLSIQVHPDDEVAGKRHNSFGKTEMWYVLDADPGAYLIIGFKEDTEKETYLTALEEGNVGDLLQNVYVKPGDVFFIPAGLVHAIGKGVMVAEIQQTSDITYRIFDFNRKDDDGNMRELHTEEALDVIDFTASEHPKLDYNAKLNDEVDLVSCQYFTTTLLELDKPVDFINNDKESFTVLMCLEGEADVNGENLRKGESMLIPATLTQYSVKPREKSRFLKVRV